MPMTGKIEVSKNYSAEISPESTSKILEIVDHVTSTENVLIYTLSMTTILSLLILFVAVKKKKR